jgi:hypothetical protein
MVLYGLACDAIAVSNVIMDPPQHPPLQPLHLDSSLNAVKLAKLERLSTEALLASLLPGQEGCLKTRPEGTILDGHHRIHILRQRGVNVDDLAREIVVRDVVKDKNKD